MIHSKELVKPEPLTGNWSGYWSRRINSEHRLVYKVTQEHILMLNLKGIIRQPFDFELDFIGPISLRRDELIPP
jgi:hypothetical protein